MTAPVEKPSAGASRCPQCGAELPPGTSASECPVCLLRAGLQPLGAPVQRTARLTPPPPPPPQTLLQPGQEFGHYRIIRALGGGGMGAVFEAEDLENGRRVALKVLNHTLDSPAARERFFREGRLAASINHPNSVYVFGTEEIAGTPVISMELVAGGTLQDRVRERGPMPPAEAVDAVLQIIAGLEAAQRTGILHRDVKPSNCFVDPDGTVKIGDFGLSISTAFRTEPSLTATGAFLGTPAFCSPEQLRGEELNARSDMYSVGATLFYLLTGRTPFEAKNLVALISTVLEQPAPSPRKWAPDLPKGLARAVRRCLEKHPGERFRTYEELRQALAPYSSAAPTPATLGFRFLAGVLDSLVLNAVMQTAMILAVGEPLRLLNLALERPPLALSWVLAGFVVILLYYGILEGVWGATPGKALCRLRVVGPHAGPPGVPRALLRAAIFVLVPLAPFWVTFIVVFGHDLRTYLETPAAVQQALGFSVYAVMASLFSSARRRNGLAAVHDLLTRTRVIARLTVVSPSLTPQIAAGPPGVETAPRVGPYHVLETLEPGHWLVGYDLSLLRRVWIRLLPAGTPPVAVKLRNLGRLGRLRWLTGRRSDSENWDAYEAPGGQPLLRLAAKPQPWSQVRFWLHDLAVEISLAQAGGTLPHLGLDRVWITGDGRAKLLDFPAPGLGLETGGPGNEALRGETASAAGAEPGVFLDRVAAVALAGDGKADRPAACVALPLPLHVRDFLRRLGPGVDAGELARALKSLLQRPSEVTRLRRAALVAGCLAFPLLAGFAGMYGVRIMRQMGGESPGLMELKTLLESRWAMQALARKPLPSDEQFAIYISAHYGALITNQAQWSRPLALALVQGEARRFAERSVAEHPAPTPRQIADADAALQPFVPDANARRFDQTPHLPLLLVHAALAFYVGLPALLAALLFRGGLVMRVAGVVFARRDGSRASRWRVFGRALMVWGPVGAAFLCYGPPSSGEMPSPPLLALAVLGGLAILSLALPGRGLPDRLAGTWPVLR